MESTSKAVLFKQALLKEKPLQVVGVINAYAALLAKKAGFSALYLSGAGLANACFGLPDLGMTTATEMAEEIRRIRAVVALPLLVDADTGFGDTLNVMRTVQLFESAGASALHLEDQAWPKRCGHLEGKRLITVNAMCDRIKAAIDARRDPNFVIMARTDAVAEEGLEASIERAARYIEAGADMIFAEALKELTQYKAFVEKLKVPILANITEFGQTPLFSLSELKSIGVSLALYPLSAFRAMNKAALSVYECLRKEGSQQTVLDLMQTRAELYQILNYEFYERK